MKIWLDTLYLSTSIDNLISDIKDALVNYAQRTETLVR